MALNIKHIYNILFSEELHLMIRVQNHANYFH